MTTDSLEKDRPQLRRFPRFTQSLHVNIRGGSGSSCHGRTVELSECGARITTREPLQVGQCLQLELFLCETDPFPIRLMGECRWSRAEHMEAVAGVDLGKSNSRSLRLLKDYLASRELEPV